MSAHPQTTIEDIKFPLRSGMADLEKARRMLWNEMRTPEQKERYRLISRALECFRRADDNTVSLEESIEKLKQKATNNGKDNNDDHSDIQHRRPDVASRNIWL